MKKTIDNPVAVRYTTVDKPSAAGFVCFRIDEGELEGTVYHYENLKFSDDEENLKLSDEETDYDAHLKFNYHIVESSWSDDMFTGKLKETFEDTVACILRDIIINQLGRIGNEDRVDDSEKSSS